MKKRKQLLTIKTDDKQTIADKLRKDFPTINFYHASTSASLMYLNLQKFKETFANRILVQTHELIEQGYAVFSGELGNVFNENSINRKGISGFPVEESMGVVSWAKMMTDTQWSKETIEKKIKELEKTSNKSFETSEGMLQKAIQGNRNRVENLKKQIESYENLKEEKVLIDSLFPVVFGCEIDQSRMKYGKSDVGKGELVVENGCYVEEIRAIFIPTAKINMAIQFLPDELKNKVKSYEEYFSFGQSAINTQSTFGYSKPSDDDKSLSKNSFKFGGTIN